MKNKKNKKNGKRKGATQNNVENNNPIANNAENDMENKMCDNLERKGTILSLIVTIVGLFSTLCAFTNFVYDVMYKINCGNFYGIPEKYFSTSINKNILYRLFVIVLLIIWLILPILKIFFRKQKDDINLNEQQLASLSVMIGIIMAVAVAHNLKVISTYDDNIILSKIGSFLLNCNIEIVAVVLAALCIIEAIGIAFLNRVSHWKRYCKKYML